MKSDILTMDPPATGKNGFTDMDGNAPVTATVDSERAAALTGLASREIRAFQKSGGMELTQRIVSVDWGNSGASQPVLEACSRAVRQDFPYWNVVSAPVAAEQRSCSLLHGMSREKILKIALSSGVVRLPAAVKYLAVILVVLLLAGAGTAALMLHFPLLETPGIIAAAIGIAVFIGIGAGMAATNGFLAKLTMAELTRMLAGSEDTGLRHRIVTASAALIVENMPVAVIVENTDHLDVLSKEVLEHIMHSGHITAIGSILWILCHEKGTASAAQFSHEIIPVKHFSMNQGSEV